VYFTAVLWGLMVKPYVIADVTASRFRVNLQPSTLRTACTLFLWYHDAKAHSELFTNINFILNSFLQGLLHLFRWNLNRDFFYFSVSGFIEMFRELYGNSGL
jgi:hypothetical protein